MARPDTKPTTESALVAPSSLSAPKSNYEKIPSVKTKYNGTWYKSRLEAKVAEAMDDLGIEWEYEKYKFVDKRYQGGQYTPDFKIPRDHIYIEVVGKIDIRHRRNAMQFVELENCISLMFDGDGGEKPTEEHPAFCFVLGDGLIVDAHGCELMLLHCEHCDSWSVVRAEGGWCCMHCGCYIGDGGKDGDNYWNNLLEAGARAGGRR